jgi:hypothetical protein
MHYLISFSVSWIILFDTQRAFRYFSAGRKAAKPGLHARHHLHVEDLAHAHLRPAQVQDADHHPLKLSPLAGFPEPHPGNLNDAARDTRDTPLHHLIRLPQRLIMIGDHWLGQRHHCHHAAHARQLVRDCSTTATPALAPGAPTRGPGLLEPERPLLALLPPAAHSLPRFISDGLSPVGDKSVLADLGPDSPERIANLQIFESCLTVHAHGCHSSFPCLIHILQ